MTGDELRVVVDDALSHAWDWQVSQYPAHGPDGMSYFYGDLADPFGEGVHVDCLLHRDSSGALLGILNYYPQDVPPYERAGAVTMWVHPQYKRQGIGTRLLWEALRRWPIDLYAQTYTPEGASLARALLQRREES